MPFHQLNQDRDDLDVKLLGPVGKIRPQAWRCRHPPAPPVATGPSPSSPNTVMPSALVATGELTTLVLLPLVLIASTQSPGQP
jgi:hypothetical protein